MARALWYALGVLGAIVVLAVFTLWIIATWTDDPDVANKLGFTGLILIFPGAFMLVGGFVEGNDA